MQKKNGVSLTKSDKDELRAGEEYTPNLGCGEQFTVVRRALSPLPPLPRGAAVEGRHECVQPDVTVPGRLRGK